MQTKTAIPTAIPTPFDVPDVCWPNGEASWVGDDVEESGSVVGRNVDNAEDGVGVEVSTRICGAILFLSDCRYKVDERFVLAYQSV
jgi:hypothetical protein